MIRIEGLRKTLDGQPVLRGVDLQVDPGEILALVGPSGTGKSVLLKHVVGLIQPDAGDVFVGGRSMGHASYRELRELRRRMGYVFQDGALLDSLTIRDNLALALDDGAYERDRRGAEDRIAETLELVNLDRSVLTKRPSQLSGGMRKRVAVARAIVNRPEIVLYDEPTAGLDPRNVLRLDELIARMRDRLNVTSITVTHDLGLVGRIADRVALLSGGRIRFLGPPEDFLASSAPDVLAFTGREPDAVRRGRMTTITGPARVRRLGVQ